MGKRRWVSFGPGVAVALLISAFVVHTRWQEGARRQAPRIERAIIIDTSKARAGLVPEVSTLLARREQLKLSVLQVAEVKQLQADWERVSAPLRKQAERAAREFRAWMSKAQQHGRVTTTDIQEHGAEVSDLSAKLVQQRLIYWESALQLLTEEQRAKVSTEGTRKRG